MSACPQYGQTSPSVGQAISQGNCAPSKYDSSYLCLNSLALSLAPLIPLYL
ncbi:Uncharacterised protein [Mycoplasmopsis synoviae]|uniref:Uncharacterized protein n=1 Tax=Mycoplasmopsis synoviae TaxID=2109 RepID=A0A3B0PRN1_MYCSY|nr:Uncharacterised protein [Mycoplasmopsis synoviae]